MRKRSDTRKRSDRLKNSASLFFALLFGISGITCIIFASVLIATAVVENYESSDSNELTWHSLRRALQTSVVTTYTDCYYNDHIYCEGSISSLLLDTITETESKLPEGTLDAFVADGWKLVVTTSRDLTSYAAAQGCDTQDYEITGLTDYDSKIIYVKASTIAIVNSLLHEYGHFEDYRRGWISDSAAFQAYYETTISDASDISYATTNAYAISSSKELFASLFNDNCLDAEDNIDLLKSAHEYVESITGEPSA